MCAFQDFSSPDPKSLNVDLHAISELNRVVHELARLIILAALDSVEEADFKFLGIATGLTKGNLSRQAALLEYIHVVSVFFHEYCIGKGYR